MSHLPSLAAATVPPLDQPLPPWTFAITAKGTDGGEPSMAWLRIADDRSAIAVALTAGELRELSQMAAIAADALAAFDRGTNVVSIFRGK